MLANLRIVIIKQTNLSDEDQEDVMNLSTAYVEWEQKTREEAEKRGELKGKQLGEQRLIIRQLNRRFGEINPALIQQVQGLSVEQLEALGEALLDFRAIADLETWLQSQSSLPRS